MVISVRMILDACFYFDFDECSRGTSEVVNTFLTPRPRFPDYQEPWERPPEDPPAAIVERGTERHRMTNWGYRAPATPV